jgi:hypothetical protein
LMHDESAHQLAASAHHVLDAVYEVVPHWLANCAAPWQAFDRARAWNDDLKREWGGTSGPLTTPLASLVAGPSQPQNEGSALSGASDPASKR